MDEEEPIEFELTPWQVSCYQVRDVISTLADIHFIALHAAEDFQLGADLVFWHHYAQVIRSMIAKDQYIPALKYRAISPLSNEGQAGEEGCRRFRAAPHVGTAVGHIRGDSPALCLPLCQEYVLPD